MFFSRAVLPARRKLGWLGAEAGRRRRLGPAVLAALATLSAGSCARRGQPPPFQRLAILRFENLGSDPSQDWLGRALAESLTAALETAPRIYALPSSRIHASERTLGARTITAPGISAERDLALAAGANRLGYGEYTVRGGRIEARLAVEDPSTHKLEAWYAASAPARQPLAVAVTLARHIWPGAAAQFSGDIEAVEDYAAALESADPAEAERLAERALALDPDFGAAWRALAQTKAEEHDAAGAKAVLERALTRPLPPVDHARLELDAAELQSDPPARLRALEGLSKLEPSDPLTWRALGDAAYAAHRYSQSAAGYQQALAIEPDDPAVLNQLGYARAWTGDLAGAEAALRRYESLRPSDPNPLDSLGDVNLLTGHLREAESAYLQSAAKMPHFGLDGSRFKAAVARLMTGDIAGADNLARLYLQARAEDKDPAVDYRAAEWDWEAGRRAEARGRMAAFARGGASGPLRELAARAYAELSVWKTALGDRAEAAEDARQAATLAGPPSAAVAAVAAMLAQPPASPSEWEARAARAFPEPARNPVRDFALAYALCLDRRFEPAARVLERIYAEGEPAESVGLPVLLAWAYLETGRTAEAIPLLRFNPIPAVSGAGPFLAFYFPRLYYLRGQAAQRQGKPGEAQVNFQLFRKLSGPTPLVWGEERAAD